MDITIYRVCPVKIKIWYEGVVRLISSRPNCIVLSPNGIGVDPFESVHMFLSRGSSEH